MALEEDINHFDSIGFLSKYGNEAKRNNYIKKCLVDVFVVYLCVRCFVLITSRIIPPVFSVDVGYHNEPSFEDEKMGDSVRTVATSLHGFLIPVTAAVVKRKHQIVFQRHCFVHEGGNLFSSC